MDHAETTGMNPYALGETYTIDSNTFTTVVRG